MLAGLLDDDGRRLGRICESRRAELLHHRAQSFDGQHDDERAKRIVRRHVGQCAVATVAARDLQLFGDAATCQREATDVRRNERRADARNDAWLVAVRAKEQQLLAAVDVEKRIARLESYDTFAATQRLERDDIQQLLGHR